MNVAAGMWRQGGPIGGGKEALAGFDPHLAAEQAVAVRHARRDDVRAINAGILAPEHEAALIFDMLRDQRTSAGILPSGVNGIYLGETPIDRLQNGAVIYAADEHFRGRTGESTDEIIHRWEVGDTNLRDVPFEIIEGLLGVAVVTHAPMFLAGLAAPLGLDAIKAKLSGKTLEHARDLAWIDVAPRLVKLVNGITALAVAASGIGVGGGVVKKLAEGDHSQLDNSPHSPDGKPPIKALGFLAAASAFLAACREFLKTGQLPTVEVTQVAVTPSTDLGQAPEPSKTPTPTETPVPPTPDVFLGVSSVDQIRAVAGIPPGFGGPGQELVVRNTVEFQARLNDSGFAPVVNEEGVVASLLSLDGDRLCVGNTPEKLFNPNAVSGEDTLLRSEAGIFQFGDAATGEVRVQVLSAVPLNGLPDNLTCVEAVVVDPNNPAGLGALRMLLVDRITHTIVGEMPAAFSGSDTVELIWDDNVPVVRVNGEELHFQFRPEFVTATPPVPTFTETPAPTATETPDPAAGWGAAIEGQIGCWGDKGVKRYSEKEAEWAFKVVSDGVLITEPMDIPISDTETVTMLTGFKGYYCVREGEKPVAKHVVIPTVVEFPDGRLYRFRGGTIIDDSPLSKDEAMKDVIGGVKGETMIVFVSPDLLATFTSFGIKKEEVVEPWLSLTRITKLYWGYNGKSLEDFFAVGDAKGVVMLPSEMVSIMEKVELP